MQEVDYEATLSTKLSIAKRIFQLEKGQVMESSEYKSYFSENQVIQITMEAFVGAFLYVGLWFNFLSQDWLKPYAAFCFLRDLFGTSDHSQWGVYSSFSEEKVCVHFHIKCQLTGKCNVCLTSFFKL